jgi:hypothetical protein
MIPRVRRSPNLKCKAPVDQQIDWNTLRLLRWNNWFYAGSASFLQSSVQEINR